MLQKNITFYDDKKILNLILKVNGSYCNIDCDYCFEKNKSLDCNMQITSEYLLNLLNNIEGKIVVTFHGGEPLTIGKDKFISLLETIKPFYPHKIMYIYLQTNGLLLDKEWIYILFEKYKNLNIEISLSLDGTYCMNSLRTDYNKKNTYKDVINAYELLRENNISAGMLSVISKNSLPFYKEYIEIIESIKNLRFVKINPLFNMINNHLTSDSITPTEFSNFIIDITKLYIKKKLYKRVAIEPILSIFQKINNIESKYCNYNTNKCYQFISLYSNNIIGPCDCFSTDDFRINNDINLTLNENISHSIFNDDKIIKNILEDCKKCDIFCLCSGGCISQMYYLYKNKSLYQDYCKSKMMLFSFAKKIKV